MWFIGVEVKQETSAPPPKKILDPPLLSNTNMLTLENTSLKYLSPLSTEVHTDKNEFDPVFSRIW